MLEVQHVYLRLFLERFERKIIGILSYVNHGNPMVTTYGSSRMEIYR